MTQLDGKLFALVRAAMTGKAFDEALTADEWQWLYRAATQQSMLGVCYPARDDMPKDVAIEWVTSTETIRGMNTLQYQEAARLTKLFAEQGRQSAILKGQANARLYPDKFLRQPGDIDIWVEGGRESVIALLQTTGLMGELASTSVEGKASASYHHVHLPVDERGVIVEVHFRPSSGNFNPLTNRRLQRWLEEEIKNLTRVEEGFNVPSIRFALMMQLSHVQRHFLGVGIGFRHICDYYILLKNSKEEDRREVASHLDSFGLRHTAEALMWVLGEVMHLDECLMISQPDSWRGEWMLREIMEGGNFGRYAKKNQTFFQSRMALLTRGFRMLRFDFWEMAYRNLSFWAYIIRTIPIRIRRGHWSLVKANERDRLKHGDELL